jgi:calcineurin-like phosphoesterase family protein
MTTTTIDKRPPPASTLKSSEPKSWWTSDLHLGHTNIREYCEGRKVLGPDVPSMNKSIIRRWNETVAPGDIVNIIGDLALGKIDESLALVPRLNGLKRLFPGNHDRCWSFAKNKTPEKRQEWIDKYKAAGLELWPEQVLMQVGKHTVMVCHFPYRGDSHDQDRFLYARPFDEGRVLLCGHVHDSWKISGKQINVGMDVWDYRPVSEAVIIQTIEEIT